LCDAGDLDSISYLILFQEVILDHFSQMLLVRRTITSRLSDIAMGFSASDLELSQVLERSTNDFICVPPPVHRTDQSRRDFGAAFLVANGLGLR
jgi:hypothetical protein